MAKPRLVAVLALSLAGGCIQFEHGPTTDGGGSSSCCSSLCEVSDTSAQCGSSSEVCAPVFDGDEVPPMWADYGVCRLPS